MVVLDGAAVREGLEALRASGAHVGGSARSILLTTGVDVARRGLVWLHPVTKRTLRGLLVVRCVLDGRPVMWPTSSVGPPSARVLFDIST